jgi:ribonucleoside-diphosphate reductase alpha chain
MLEFSDHAISLLENYYMMEGDTTPLDAFKRASQAFSAGDKELADRILSYVENGWFMFSSPILSNARLEGQKKSGLPISCFLTYVDDSLEGLISHSEELRWMSVLGGGVGGHWSNVRSVSDKAPGPIPFIKTIDSDVEAYRQGKCYHPDVEILTENGWVRFSDLKEGVKVAQVGDALDISFVIPTELIKEHHEGSLIRVYDGTNVDVLVTPNHSMVVDMGYGLTKVRADELLCNQEVLMFKEDGNHFTTQAIKKDEVPYNGLVYCALVPTGRLLVRSNGRSLICGNTRKGSYAAYMDISHPDIIEFLNIRVPTGGDTNRKCFNLNNAVNLSDDFMNAVVEGKEWNLIDPHTKQVKETLQARDLWQRILEVRFRTGEPYFFFSDTANKHLPQSLKDKGLKIHGSNLCNEIFLCTDKDRSAVCCLSSLNLEYFDEWKDTSIVEDCITFLDNVLQYFIDNAPQPQMKRAIYSAIQERSLGLGAMGFHSYLQRKNIAFESAIAKSVNMRIFRTIKERAVKQTETLAKTRGEYLDGVGTGRRNSHLLAIAPNANSAIILDTSPSIEPWKSNAFTHRTRAGSFLSKNKYLDKILVDKNLPKEEYDAIWQSIILNQGSVQHLDCLTDYQKDVFKTAFELDQMWLIEHGADRQVHICQGQSLNLFFPSGSDKAYVNAVHLSAWKKGLKGLYYLRTSTGVVAEKVSTKIERKALKDYDECVACQG